MPNVSQCHTHDIEIIYKSLSNLQNTSGPQLPEMIITTAKELRAIWNSSLLLFPNDLRTSVTIMRSAV